MRCRLVADLAAQLLTLGPWKVVYEQLAAINAPWFEQHSVANQLTAQSGELTLELKICFVPWPSMHSCIHSLYNAYMLPGL